MINFENIVVDTEFGVTQRSIALDEVDDFEQGANVSVGGAVSNRRMALRSNSKGGPSEVQRAEEIEMNELGKGVVQRNGVNSNNY